MNKKNLSVVMAGAMLATSVAPVLAETTTVETYEVTKGNAGLLINKLDTLFETKFDKMDSNKDLANKSVYGYLIREAGETTWQKIQANGTLTAVSGDEAKDGIDDTSLIKALVNNASNATKEYEIKIIDRGHREESGKILSTEAVTVDWENAKKYTGTEIADEGDKFLSNDYNSEKTEGTNFEGLKDMTNAAGTSVIKTVTYDKGADSGSGDTNKSDNTITLTFESGAPSIVLKEGEYLYDFTAPLNNKGEVLSVDYAKRYPAEVFGFKRMAETTATKTDIKEKEIYRVNLVNGDAKVEYNTTDLYDGFMLTTKGHELLREIKEAKTVVYGAAGTFSATDDIETVIDKDGNNYRTKITITDENGNVKIVTIKGSNKEALTTLGTWLNAKKASVDILAGDNRYATAVEIAKDFVAHQYATGNANALKNIVLVNGEALVDGLAAAPYAKAKNAPILLTADNKLSKETKEYLKELLDGRTNVEIGKPDTLPTITIIGGTSVVSSNVVEELRDMGFKVERLAGDNREQTSLEVAEALSNIKVRSGVEDDGGTAIGTKYAFVVGANGEADAMSIASYASATNTPIIVSKSDKGLSTMALNDLQKYTKNITLIGGENVIPESTEKELKDSVAKGVTVNRIAGKNRQETNAMIMKTYHNAFTDVLVAKDGSRNKLELIDALPVSIFASANTYTNRDLTPKSPARPVVLATNGLSDEQLNQIILGVSSTASSTVYQVGYGVNESVMHKIVEKLGLANK